jgi:hypothetical protein
MTSREAETKRQWLAKLEELGPDLVRAKLSNPNAAGSGDGASVIGIFPVFTDLGGEVKRINVNQKFCEDWLAERDKSISRRSSQIFWLTAIGAVAAVVAAIASILALLGD